MTRTVVRWWISLALAGGLVALPRPAVAQPLPPRDTASVEILGLSRWTRRMLEDSLSVHAPGVALASTASARALREVLGFRDAEVTEFHWQDDDGTVRGPVYVLSVIEPHDSTRIRFNELSPDARTDSRWPAILSTVTDTSGRVDDLALGVAVSGYTLARDVGVDSAFALMVKGDPAGAFRSAPVWRALTRHVARLELQRALATLAANRDPAQRIAAIGVLLNFPERDEAWHGLAHALLDPHPYVRGVAVQALSALAYAHPRAVDWRGASGDLRRVLGGTNLAALIRLLVVLDQTRVDRRLAAALLSGGNATLLLAHAGSDVHMVRQGAWTLLGRLSGRRNAGVEQWRRWAAGLPTGGAR